MFGRTPRQRTATHEAGHVEVARALGATRLQARVTDTPTRTPYGTSTGHFTGRFDGSKTDEAIVMLAGAAAVGERAAGPDLAAAKKLLRGSGMSLRAAEKEAARLVRQNRGAIARSARRLDRRGRL